jgi:hypothetical protein
MKAIASSVMMNRGLFFILDAVNVMFEKKFSLDACPKLPSNVFRRAF